MDLVDAETIFYGAAGLAGLAEDEVTGTEFAILRRSLSRRLLQGYRFAPWPELGTVEERWFRAGWDVGTSYAAGAEVFHFASKTYYQALRAHSGQAPADSNGVVNDAYWAESASEYDADNWSATEAYAAGELVYYPDTNRYYQAHSTPPTGAAPTNGSYWGVLTPFDRYVAYEQAGKTKLGDVTGVSLWSPKLRAGICPIEYRLSDNGVQVLRHASSVWIEWRARPEVLKGAVWDAAATYAAADQVYFNVAGDVPGNFYNCVSGTSAGESPVTAAAKWEVVEIPWWLERFLIGAVYADWLRGDRQGDKAAMEESMALATLAEERLTLENSEGQRGRTVVGG